MGGEEGEGLPLVHSGGDQHLVQGQVAGGKVQFLAKPDSQAWSILPY